MPRKSVFPSHLNHAAALNSDHGGPQQVPFRPITEPIHEFSPWTSAEQAKMGRRVRVRPEKRQWLVKYPALCLPQSKACREWAEWTTARENLPVGAGFAMWHESEYSAEAAKSSNPHTAEDQERSALTTGKPIVFWQWLTSVDEPAQGSGGP